MESSMEDMIADLQRKKELNPKLKEYTMFQTIRMLINRKEWNKKSSFQKWCWFYGIGRMCMKPVGLPIFEDHHNVAKRAFILIFFLVIYMVISIYTTIYYTRKGDFSRALPPTCVLGIAICLCPLGIVTFTESRKALNFATSYGGKYVFDNNKKDREYNLICSEHIEVSIRGFFIKMLIMGFFYLVSQVWPVYKRLTEGTRTTLTEVRFPYIPEDSDAEYYGNLILQGFAAVLGGLAIFALEVAIHLGDTLCSIVPKMAPYYLKNYAMEIADKRTSIGQLKSSLSNICNEALYYDFCNTDRALLLCSNVNLLPIHGKFKYFQFDYAAGYGLALVMWVQLYFFCELSQYIEDCVKSASEQLFHFEWYNLPALQKDFMILIGQKQKTAIFSAGPIGSIDFELFSDISKRIYSFLMCLFNFTG